MRSVGDIVGDVINVLAQEMLGRLVMLASAEHCSRAVNLAQIRRMVKKYSPHGKNLGFL